MTKDNSNKSQPNHKPSEGKAILKDESSKRGTFIVNESRSETITSHLASPKKPIDTDTTKK